MNFLERLSDDEFPIILETHEINSRKLARALLEQEQVNRVLLAEAQRRKREAMQVPSRVQAALDRILEQSK